MTCTKSILFCVLSLLHESRVKVREVEARDKRTHIQGRCPSKKGEPTFLPTRPGPKKKCKSATMYLSFEEGLSRLFQGFYFID